MNNLKTLAISIGSAVLIGIVIGSLIGGRSPELSETDILKISNEVAKSVPVGAVANPDFSSPYIGVGGVRLFAARTSFLGSTTALQSGYGTTTCSLAAPRFGTSTLLSASIRMSNTLGTTTEVTFVKATTTGNTGAAIGGYATNSQNVLGVEKLVAKANQHIMASTSFPGVKPSWVNANEANVAKDSVNKSFAPGDYLNVNMGSVTGIGGDGLAQRFFPDGTCSALWMVND